MTYNHERAKVLCPEAAKRVEELEGDLQAASEELARIKNSMAVEYALIEHVRLATGHPDIIGRDGFSLVSSFVEWFKSHVET